jgi:hypothetical protein
VHVDRHPMQVMWDEIGVTFILLTIASCVHIDRHPMQVMWDEIGEAEDDRQGPLQLFEECLNVYRTKVEQVLHHRAQLKWDIVDSVVEVNAICATIGELPATVQTVCSSLKVHY